MFPAGQLIPGSSLPQSNSDTPVPFTVSKEGSVSPWDVSSYRDTRIPDLKRPKEEFPIFLWMSRARSVHYTHGHLYHTLARMQSLLAVT